MQKSKRKAGWREWRMVALGVAVAGVSCLLTVGCDRSEPAPAYAPRSATEPGPSTQKMQQEAQAEQVQNLERIPPVGTPVAVKMGNGEIWNKYPSGLMMYDVRPGNGIQPREGQTCHVYYKGTFPNGEVFDQSGKDAGTGKRKTFDFQLGTKGIIKGWNLAFSTMHVGGKRKIYLPPDLAYGAHGALPKIPPNQPLLFEIELVDVTGQPVNLPAETEPEAKKLEAPVAGPKRPETQPGK